LAKSSPNFTQLEGSQRKKQLSFKIGTVRTSLAWAHGSIAACVCTTRWLTMQHVITLCTIA